MKNLIIFLSGCAVGAGITIICLHKEIKKKLSEISSETENARTSDSEAILEDLEDNDEVPFVVGEKVHEISEKRAKPDTHKTNYSALVRDLNMTPTVPEAPEVVSDMPDDERFVPVVNKSELDDKEYGRGYYIFYKGDGTVCLEDGTIIRNPDKVLGKDWDQYIGIIFDSTSLVYDKQLSLINEIRVEDGLYSDEYGDFVEED